MTELSSAIDTTRQMPPFPGPLETLGIDRLPYAQLHADLWTLKQYDDDWSRLATSTRTRLWRVYPEYLAAATRQRVMAFAATTGLTTQPQAFGYWTRLFGDPFLEHRRLLTWFLAVVEASPE